jgi:putative flippase GtrA
MIARSEVKRFAQFSLVGVANTLIDIIAFDILLFLNAAPLVASGLSFMLANINSYVANRNWTFADKKSSKPVTQYGTYLLTSVVGLLINLVVMKLAITTIHGIPEFYLLNGAKIVAIGLTVLWNYATSRYIIFK